VNHSTQNDACDCRDTCFLTIDQGAGQNECHIHDGHRDDAEHKYGEEPEVIHQPASQA
jgi:hypothetical protein